MSDNPTTFQGEPDGTPGIEWNDTAELHMQEDGGGLLHRFKTIRRGTFAGLIDFVMDLPEAEQPRYAILKNGDRRIEIGEIRTLFRRSDFPGNAGG
ncbi:hypothetical protein [Novosphingobium album (ex Liu et al. 2023)]|uniref:Uncharacterized protein n=1 Tax=Novosphingobium album (ex Liu et al. 2023) TaxID=3031130 RepID=A0ABT5WSL1_9SPHN|nr:hypothetical protein [Novosphingobium album (ex Liu et al. 2023)]MDE8652736.1 hypothetical protein [Novosphingobium album (ex Liu et al. 2023)]